MEPRFPPAVASLPNLAPKSVISLTVAEYDAAQLTHQTRQVSGQKRAEDRGRMHGNAT